MVAMHTRPHARRLASSLVLLPLVAGLIAPTLLVGCSRGSEQAASSSRGTAEVFVVEVSDFDMAIPVSGELAAQKQIEVRNRLESKAVITEIVSEGKSVKKGDVVLRLAEEEIRDKIKDAKDKVNTADSEMIAAEQSLAIKENQRASELEKADLAVDTAQLALLAWENGEVVKKRQELDLGKQTAEIDLARLKDRFQESSKLVQQNFISKDEFEKDRIAMIQAEVKAKQAVLDQEVYEKYTYKQDEAKKKSDVDQAIAERKRTEQRNDAEIVKAKADVESARFKVESARDRLQSFETQLGYCTVVAPSDGLVVYATSIDSGGGGRGGGDAQPPQVGTELKPNELVIILPDTSQMVANLKVSEALSGRIRPEQGVTVYSDALPNVPVTGRVQSVSVLAASGGWRDPNRRDYTVRVMLDADPALGLKPSMRCKAEILLDRVSNAVSVPIQAIFRQGPIAFVYVSQSGGYAQRQVQLGRASELRVEVLDGLKQGERVLLREPVGDEVTGRLDFDALQQQMPKEAKPERPATPPAADPAGTKGGEAGGAPGGTPGGPPNGAGPGQGGGPNGERRPRGQRRGNGNGSGGPPTEGAPGSGPSPAPSGGM